MVLTGGENILKGITGHYRVQNVATLSISPVHPSRVMAADTWQSTTLSCLLWKFVFENYLNQSSDRRRKRIRMRPRTTCFISRHPQTLLKLGTACSRLAFASVGASFGCSTRGPSTAYVGVETSGVLQVHVSRMVIWIETAQGRNCTRYRGWLFGLVDGNVPRSNWRSAWFRKVFHPTWCTTRRCLKPASFQCRVGRCNSKMETEIDK